MRPTIAQYDHIVIHSSGGKDSQCVIDEVVRQAHDPDTRRRIVVVHAALGRVEWPGAMEIAEHQAQFYGVSFSVVRRTRGDLLDQVRARGRWPGPATRYCTSDQKRDPIAAYIRKLPGKKILSCLGLRAEESRTRAKRPTLTRDARLSNGKRTVDVWLPIHDWTTEDVWRRIRASGAPYHPVYDRGMNRLSCSFCIFAPRRTLLLAGRMRPNLLDEYVRIERAIGHRFQEKVSLEEIRDELRKTGRGEASDASRSEDPENRYDMNGIREIHENTCSAAAGRALEKT